LNSPARTRKTDEALIGLHPEVHDAGTAMLKIQKRTSGKKELTRQVNDAPTWIRW